MDWSTTTELSEILDHTAERIVVEGTRAESRTLLEMGRVAWELSPGAAEALVDWGGSEIARLRAFGIVHGVLLHDLPANAQRQLSTRLRGTAAEESAA